ncbi:MAG TPA: hypothetical protein VFU69_01875 [Ktedonobacterales bacterium]|nr:hypothetical protein [Ktedonobacterales bacterium]
MGSFQPDKTPGVSVQQLSRQVQMAVTDALRTLDQVRAIDPASQDEVDSLRSVVWSDLTGLEAEFGREEGPRAELLDRFFTHLLSNGDHIGQIEALAGALLGGEPPPSQPPPDSPVAGLFRLHGSLMTIRRKWQEAALPRSMSHPVMPISPPAAPPLLPKKEAVVSTRNEYFDEMGPPPVKQEVVSHPIARGRPLAERPTRQPARPSVSDRLLGDLGFTSSHGPGRAPDVDTPRPRVLFSFVAVFVILALMGVGVIYLGLNNSSSASNAIVPSVIPTFSLTLPPTTPPPAPTLNPAAPRLQVTGNPLIVPCPGKGTSGFVLRNTGGQKLNWSARVNRAGGSARPISVQPASGVLFGPANSGTDIANVTVTANLGNIDGTITITTNIPGAAGTAVITYHIQGC